MKPPKRVGPVPAALGITVPVAPDFSTGQIIIPIFHFLTRLGAIVSVYKEGTMSHLHLSPLSLLLSFPNAQNSV